MRMKDAYYVNIDFDWDIYSEAVGEYIFTTLGEVKLVVHKALDDMLSHLQSRGREIPEVDIKGHYVSICKVIRNDDVLESFIEEGGSDFGNWSINCRYITY